MTRKHFNKLLKHVNQTSIVLSFCNFPLSAHVNNTHIIIIIIIINHLYQSIFFEAPSDWLTSADMYTSAQDHWRTTLKVKSPKPERRE